MATITRRAALAALGAAAASMPGTRRLFAQAVPPVLAGDTLFRDVAAYANLGEHRTATDVDRRTSMWLRDELRKAGVAADLHPFTLKQFFVDRVSLTVGDRSIDAFPLWWPSPTGASPLGAPLAAAGADMDRARLAGRIVVVKLPAIAGASITPNSPVQRIVAGAANAGAAAVIAISNAPTGELVALNAMAGTNPWPLPLVVVGSRDEAALTNAAAQQASASLLLDGRYVERAEAFETVGRIGSGAQTVIVSTPSSGWFRCAGERGPGIALWLALARWVAAERPRASFIFVASSGHELDGVGIGHFISSMAPAPGDVKCWLHLGAGIATYEYRFDNGNPRRLTTASPARRLYSAPPFARALTDAFAPVGITPIVTDKPGGEMVAMAERGYAFMGFAGGSTFHHMPGDLPERITGPELLEPVARALTTTLSAVAL